MLPSSKIKIIHPLFFQVQIEINQLQCDKIQPYLQRQNTAESYSNLQFGKSIQFLPIVQHLFKCQILPTADHHTEDKKCYAFYSKRCYENYYKNKKEQQIKFNSSAAFNDYKNKYKLTPHLKESSYCKLGSTYFIVQRYRKEEIYRYFQLDMNTSQEQIRSQKIEVKKKKKEQFSQKIFMNEKKNRNQDYKQFNIQQLSLNQSQSSKIDIKIENEQDSTNLKKDVNEKIKQKQSPINPIKKQLNLQQGGSLIKSSQIKINKNNQHILKFKQDYANQNLRESKTSIIFENSPILINKKEIPKLTKKQMQILEKKQSKKDFVLLKFSLNGEIIGQQYVKKMSFVRNQFLDNYDVYFDQHYSHKLQQKMIMAVIDKTFFCKQKYELIIPTQLTEQNIRSTQYKPLSSPPKLNRLNKHFSERKIFKKKVQNQLKKKQLQEQEQQQQQSFQFVRNNTDLNKIHQFYHNSSDNKYFRIQKRKTLLLDGPATQEIHRKESKSRKVSHHYDQVNPQKKNRIFQVSHKKISDILSKRKQKNNQQQFADFEQDFTFNSNNNKAKIKI